jgi:hypothetical protein
MINEKYRYILKGKKERIMKPVKYGIVCPERTVARKER